MRPSDRIMELESRYHTQGPRTVSIAIIQYLDEQAEKAIGPQGKNDIIMEISNPFLSENIETLTTEAKKAYWKLDGKGYTKHPVRKTLEEVMNAIEDRIQMPNVYPYISPSSVSTVKEAIKNLYNPK